MKPSKILSHATFLAIGFCLALVWQSFQAFISFRPVQYLRSDDRQYQAVLERREQIDLNFRVQLNGKTIYLSPDFSPDRTLAFRETLTWDDKGTTLVLEVGGRRLFGYIVLTNQKLSDAELLQVKITPVPVEEYRFEGKWPAPAGE